MVRLLAALMTAVHASVWVFVSRWERPGKGAQHRVKLRAPRLIGLGFDVGLYASLSYPALVVIAPRWTYEGWGNWSSSIDAALQAGGLVLWVLGMAVLLWASWVMGRHLAIGGLAEDHELVTHGPYRYIRHPAYASFAAIAIGTALAFRSYVLLGLSVMLMVTALLILAGCQPDDADRTNDVQVAGNVVATIDGQPVTAADLDAQIQAMAARGQAVDRAGAMDELIDLMDALEASLAATRGQREQGKRPTGQGSRKAGGSASHRGRSSGRKRRTAA
jgi:protein-S-isoprenylcysteine O-methyltransferase Ste14